MMNQYYISEREPYLDFFKKHDAAVVYSTDKNINYHHHSSFFELGYVLNGSAVHNLNGEETVIRRGDYFIMDKTSAHGYNCNKDCEIVNLIFHPDYIDATLSECTKLSELVSHFSISYLPQNIGRIHWQIFHDSNGEVRRLIDLIAKELYEDRPGSRTIVRSYMIVLLVTVMRHVGDEENIRYSTLVRDIITVIEQKYTTSLSLTNIAKRLNYSPAHLSRLFSEEVGQSFSEYLQSYRLEIAAHKLATTSHPVCRIAESVGYNDVRFFYQLFKREYGLTPSNYRKKIKNAHKEQQ